MFSQITMKGSRDVFAKVSWACVNRTGAAVALGDIVALDLAAGQSETAAGQGPGGVTGLPVPDAIFCNVIVPANQATNVGQIFGVVIDLGSQSGADDTDVMVQFNGACQAKVGSNVSARRTLLECATTEGDMNLITYSAATGLRPIAFSTGTADGSSTETLCDVIFFGWTGITGVEA